MKLTGKNLMKFEIIKTGDYPSMETFTKKYGFDKSYYYKIKKELEREKFKETRYIDEKLKACIEFIEAVKGGENEMHGCEQTNSEKKKIKQIIEATKNSPYVAQKKVVEEVNSYLGRKRLNFEEALEHLEAQYEASLEWEKLREEEILKKTMESENK